MAHDNTEEKALTERVESTELGANGRPRVVLEMSVRRDQNATEPSEDQTGPRSRVVGLGGGL